MTKDQEKRIVELQKKIRRDFMTNQTAQKTDISLDSPVFSDLIKRIANTFFLEIGDCTHLQKKELRERVDEMRIEKECTECEPVCFAETKNLVLNEVKKLLE